jgi:hypothetical protein
MNTSLEDSDLYFSGMFYPYHLGEPVTGAGDVNGDGYDDMLIGSIGEIVEDYDNRYYKEETFLFLGKGSNWEDNILISKAHASFEDGKSYWIDGLLPSFYAPSSGAGDVDGDGLDDIIIGMPYKQNSSGLAYLIFPDHNEGPDTVYSINTYSDPDYSIEATEVRMYDSLYIQLIGDGSNSTSKNVVFVDVNDNYGNQLLSKLPLYETGFDTDVFQGVVRVTNRTHENHRWVGSSPGETLDIVSIDNPTMHVPVTVGWALPQIRSNTKEDVSFEDEPFEKRYSVFGGKPPFQWKAETNASWLTWNSSDRSIRGKPDNGDVGSYWINIIITDAGGFQDSLNSTLEVVNTPPVILSGDLTTIPQDIQYYSDYDSSDDDQGEISWHLTTNASWLGINSTTGELRGTPTGLYVGDYIVNIVVDDGNGGQDWTEFILTVTDLNDPPLIINSDITTAFEDEEYFIDYNATDIDYVNETFNWSLHTDASWLTIDENTGILQGIPNNSDVGVYHVNVTVKDANGSMSFHYFNLEVINRPPTILTIKDTTEIDEDRKYLVDYSCDDDEQGDITWHLETNASWIFIDNNTGILSGVPVNKDVGKQWVNVSVDDGNGGIDWHNFTVRVNNTNDPPEILSIPTMVAYAEIEYVYEIKAIDIDRGDKLIYFFIKAYMGMQLDQDSGLFNWTPTLDQLGEHKVIIGVTDKISSTNQSFSIFVHPNLTVTIDHPIDNDTVSNIIKITGSAHGPDGLVVKISVDGRGWKTVCGTEHWTYQMDTHIYSNGKHTIVVRSLWGEYISEEATLTVHVKNKKNVKTDDNYWLLLLLIIPISLILSIVFIRKMKKEDWIITNDMKAREEE